MPIYEYECPEGHQTTQVFKTFDEAAPHTEAMPCKEDGCTLFALRKWSVPMPGHFYGNPEGYYKPSPTKRTSYKLAAASGNEGSAG